MPYLPHILTAASLVLIAVSFALVMSSRRTKPTRRETRAHWKEPKK